MTKQAKGDMAGAKADFETAKKLDPELASEEVRRGFKRQSSVGSDNSGFLDGKLKIDLPADFSHDPDDPKDPKTLAKFSGPDGAWGAVLRGTHGTRAG